MPKAKARKRRKAKSNVTSGASYAALADVSTSAESPPVKSQAALRSKPSGTQGLVMAGMVALGCWGMAISFIFFTTDPNRYMYGGIAVLMALMWSYMFGVRLRKARQQK
jgi:hypothetical protein